MTLAQWNQRQLRVMVRVQRMYRVELSLDAFRQLASRYAEKHERERPHPQPMEAGWHWQCTRAK